METQLTNGEPERQAVSRAVRKQVTVLFCDIAGYTERAASVDPEELAEDVREFHESCSRIAASCQGYVSSYQGDGIMVLFGHPSASEFSPERAVRAGMAMVEARPGLDALWILARSEGYDHVQSTGMSRWLLEDAGH